MYKYIDNIKKTCYHYIGGNNDFIHKGTNKRN